MIASQKNIDINTKMFRRYWSFHDEVNGNQYVHDEVKGVKLNSSN